MTLVGIANWPPVNGQTWRYRLVFGLRNGLWFGLCITLYNAPERSWLELFTSAFVGGLAFSGTTMVFLRRTEPRALIPDANIKRQLIALCLSWFCLLAMLWAENSISDAGILAISVVLAQPLLIADNRLKTIQNACFFMVMALYVSVKFFGAQVL